MKCFVPKSKRRFEPRRRIAAEIGCQQPPLSSELKEHLHSIWSDQETLQLLIDRVRRQLRDKNEEGARAAESDLNELTGELVRNVPAGESQLTAVRNELRQSQQQIALAKLEPYLREDLSSAAAQDKLQTLLDSLGEAVNAPLPSLLRIETDLENRRQPQTYRTSQQTTRHVAGIDSREQARRTRPG